MNVNWGTCGEDNHWCDFERLTLNSNGFEGKKGVYIIWSGKTVIRVGSGLIKDRISVHKDNLEINKYKDLKVTWAKVNATQMEGVEKYLSDVLDPLVGERFPKRTPIEVNLPWD